MGLIINKGRGEDSVCNGPECWVSKEGRDEKKTRLDLWKRGRMKGEKKKVNELEMRCSHPKQKEK